MSARHTDAVSASLFTNYRVIFRISDCSPTGLRRARPGAASRDRLPALHMQIPVGFRACSPEFPLRGHVQGLAFSFLSAGFGVFNPVRTCLRGLGHPG